MAPFRTAGRRWVALGWLLAAAVLATDALTPRGFAHASLYVPALLPFWLSRSERAILAFAALVPALALAGLWLSPPGFELRYVLANRAVSVLVVWALAAFALRELRLRRALEGARAAAEAADRAKAQFLASLGHELRTPLNAVIGFSDAMAGEAFGPLGERYRGYARDIHASGSHLLAVADTLLELHRVELGHAAPAQEPVDVAALLAEVAGLLRPLAEAAGVDLRWSLDPATPPLKGDARLLRQALLNLAGNGVKFNRPGGRVEVRAAPAGGGVELRVEDDGPGIAEADHPHVFEAFRRGAAVGGVPGSGLGLALVRRVAELHGGDAFLRSPPGGGATVGMRLPDTRTAAAGNERDQKVHLTLRQTA